MTRRTDWESVESWYHDLVGEEGHYYHQHVILPKLIPLLNLQPNSSLLDLACGQGILARHIPKIKRYHGVDLAPSFIAKAKKVKEPFQQFTVGDICQPLPIQGEPFTHAALILALQNLEHPIAAIQNAAKHLQKGGVFISVMNHPCFRIPRQSHWGVDEEKKLQYRRVDRYLTPLKIPLQSNPGKGQASSTIWTFHHSLTDYSKFLADAGFSIALIEEWVSDKKSTGKTAKMENRAREEFPLFLMIKAVKN